MSYQIELESVKKVLQKKKYIFEELLGSNCEELWKKIRLNQEYIQNLDHNQETPTSYKQFKSTNEAFLC